MFEPRFLAAGNDRPTTKCKIQASTKVGYYKRLYASAEFYTAEQSDASIPVE